MKDENFRLPREDLNGLIGANVIRYKSEAYKVIDEEARDELQEKQDKLSVGKGLKLENNTLSLTDDVSTGSGKTYKAGAGIDIAKDRISMKVKAGHGLRLEEGSNGEIYFLMSEEEPENIDFTSW